MSLSSNPKTIVEWHSCFARYTPTQLLSKAKAMNTMAFVADLRSEGIPMGEIESIFRAIASRLVSAGFPAPRGIFDLSEMVKDDPEATPNNFRQSGVPFDDSKEPSDLDALPDDTLLDEWENPKF